MPTNQIDRATPKSLNKPSRGSLGHPAYSSVLQRTPAYSSVLQRTQAHFRIREMSSISLMDIIDKEYSLGDKILSQNTATTAKCINNTCAIFNKITQKEIDNHREEYYKVLLPKKIEKTIENKTFSILKNPSNVNTYNTPEEYDAELVVLTSQINESNYDSILAIMIDKFKDYVRECYFYHNSGNRYYMIGILMNELYNFIKHRMKHEFKKEDFGEYDDDVSDIIMNYDYERSED